jgi:putative oxidoreductase
MLAVEMAAIRFFMGPTWIWLDRWIEYPLLMDFLALYIVFRGRDRYSLDRLIGREL